MIDVPQLISEWENATAYKHKDKTHARRCLESFDWNLEEAISAYYDQGDPILPKIPEEGNTTASNTTGELY